MNVLIGKFVSMWIHPWATVKSVKTEGADVKLGPSMIFIVAMALVSGIVSAIMGQIFPQTMATGQLVPKAVNWLMIVIVPIVSFIGSFLGAFILWGFIFGLLKSTGNQYKLTYRLMALLAAFSPLSALLAPLPKVGIVVAIIINVWATIVLIRGMILVMDTPPVRTWVVSVLFFGLLILMGVAAQLATRQSLPGMAGLPGGAMEGMNAGDMGLEDNEALTKQLEALTEQAKQGTAADEQKK